MAGEKVLRAQRETRPAAVADRPAASSRSKLIIVPVTDNRGRALPREAAPSGLRVFGRDGGDVASKQDGQPLPFQLSDLSVDSQGLAGLKGVQRCSATPGTSCSTGGYDCTC